MSKATFINHCGADSITFDELKQLPDPVALTETHFPIRHDLLIETAKEHLIPSGYEIVREEYSLRQEESKKSTSGKGFDDMFGIMEFKSRTSDHSQLCGIRNSSTMNFLAQIGAGERVFVCDNLSFSAQIVVGRKHTKNIERDLPKLMGKAVSELGAQFAYAEQRVEIYKESPLSRSEVHDIMMMSMQEGGCPASKLPRWLAEFDKPTHAEFERRDAWGLKNAFTEIAKGMGFEAMQKRTGILTGVLDQAVDIHNRVDLGEFQNQFVTESEAEEAELVVQIPRFN